MTTTPPAGDDGQNGQSGQNGQGPQGWGQPNQPGDGSGYYGQQPGWGQPGQPGGPGGPGMQNPYYQPPQPMRPEDQRLWATLVHVGGILFNFLVPLIGYLILRDRGQFVREHTRVALNFHITMALAWVAGWVLIAVLLNWLVWAAIGVVSIIFGIMAAIAANQGRFYKYPLSIEFIKH